MHCIYMYVNGKLYYSMPAKAMTVHVYVTREGGGREKDLLITTIYSSVLN